MGTLSVKVRSDRAHAKAKDEEITIEIDWRTLSQSWQAAKVYTLARLREFLTRYDEHLKQKEREKQASWPPHSLFCEKRCCQKSFNSYIRHLKKEISFGADGHIQ
jgi:coproporphyrinogen III oxidase-like Fe-S oxidoreductase